MLSTEAVKNYVGDLAYRRGLQIFRERGVTQIKVDVDNFSGVVRDNGLAYEVFVYLEENVISGSSCKCLSGEACEHVAALCLRAMLIKGKSADEKFSMADLGIDVSDPVRYGARKALLSGSGVRKYDGKNGVDVKKNVEWKNDVGSLLDGDDGVVDSLELAVSFERVKFSVLGNLLALKVRPMLFSALEGRSSFARISWRNALFLGGLKLNDAQMVFFKQLYSCVKDELLDLNSWGAISKEKAESFWYLIKDCARLGIKLVNGGRDGESVVVSDSFLEPCLEISDSGGALRISGVYGLGGVSVEKDRILLFEKAPMFAVVADRPFSDSYTVARNFGFYGLDVKSLRKFEELKNKPIVVPFDQISAFISQFLPKLSKQFKIINRCRHIVIPHESSCRLVVALKNDESDGIKVSFRYLYDGVSVDVASEDEVVEANIGKVYRNFHKENLLRAEVSSVFRQFSLSKLVYDVVYDLRECVFVGVDAVLLQNGIVPLLEKLQGVVLERSADLRVFKLEEGSPVIRFSVGHGVSGESGDSGESGGLIFEGGVGKDNGCVFFNGKSGENYEDGFGERFDAGDTDWFDLNVRVFVGGEEVEFKRVFAALSKSEEYLFLNNGRYVSLSCPAFDKLREFILESQKIIEEVDGKIKISRYQAGLWSELKKVGIVDEQAAEWEESLRGLLDGATVSVPEIPATFLAHLRQYQIEGFAWMSFLYRNGLGGILADDMGLGKTIQALALFCSVTESEKKTIDASGLLADHFELSSDSVVDGTFEENVNGNLDGKIEGNMVYNGVFEGADNEGSDIGVVGRNPFLVIAPTSVVENWDLEIKKFAPSLRTVVLRKGKRDADYKKIDNADVVIISYALAYRDIQRLLKFNFKLVILDEAQFLKNYQSKIYGALRRLKTSCRIALTGTPIENNLMELWSIFSVTCPGLFPSPEVFKELYQRPIEVEGNKDRLDRLRVLIRPFLLRRKKELVARELPPKSEQTLLLDMNSEHEKIYHAYLQHERQKVLGLLEGDGFRKNRIEILSALTKMRLLCLSPALVDEKYVDVKSSKLEVLEEQISTIVSENHRILIFSQFTKFLAEVRVMLDKLGIDYSYLDGSTRNRKEVITEFKNNSNIPIFLISLKAGGFGLNLTEADYCIILDPWWNPQTENQAVDRAHRIGQEKNVFIYKLILKGSIEEKVQLLQERKKILFKNVLEADAIFSSMLTEDDIRKIFD